MAQQINDNFQLLAGLPIDDRNKKPTIAERDAISLTRRYQGLKCFVDQTQTEYMLLGGILNSNWVGTAGANVTGALETIIDGFYALTAGKSTLLDWEVGDKFRGWIGDRYLVGTILTLPVSLPSDIDNPAKVELALDSDVISGDLVTYTEILTTNKQIFTMPVGAKIERIMQNEAEIVETTNVLYPKRYSKSANVATIIAPTTVANNRITILYRL